MDHDAARLVEEWLAGPNSEASGYFSYQALEHYRPAVLHWLTVGCGAEGESIPDVPDPDRYLRPTPTALQEWAIGYAGAARSRDAACGAVRSVYRWLETPATGGGPGLVPTGTARSLQFQRGGNFAAGLPGQTTLARQLDPVGLGPVHQLTDQLVVQNIRHQPGRRHLRHGLRRHSHVCHQVSLPVRRSTVDRTDPLAGV